MSAGDFYIRRNNSDTTAVPNAGGGNEDAAWDTEVYDEGSIVTYSDPNLQVDTGLYFIIYTEYFSTTDTTTNERIEIQGEIHISGTGVVGGYGQDYIRKSSGDQEAIVQGSMFLQVTSDNTDIFIRFYRTDNSTTGTVNRVPGYGGVTILEMDDSSHNFGFVSASASEATSGTTERTLVLNTSDKVDTGFSLASNQLTVSNAGRYLAHFEMNISQSGTGREITNGYLRKNGTTEITGTRAFCYNRGSDSCQDGALSWSGIIDLAASDSIDVRWVCPTGSTTTCAAGTGILQMWQLPSGADECIMEATTGDYNADDADFEWDTLPHIDTGSFTATAGNSNIDVDQNDHLLVFATFAQVTDSTPQRACPFLTVENNDNEYNYICGSGYHRNSSTSNFAVSVAGLANTVKSGRSIEIHTLPIATTGALANTKGQFSILSLESIWSYTYTLPPVVTDVNTDEQINVASTGNVITGEDFETSQGSGKVELWSDLTGTIKVAQTVTTWTTGTSITFTNVQGTLAEGTNYLVVTTDSALESNKFLINLGRGAYDPVASTDADLYWTMNNNYTDTGARNDNKPFNAVQRGNYSFQAVPICRSNTHSFYIPDNGGSEPANSDYTNLTNTHTYRDIAGWVRLEELQQTPAVIYEEGGGVNNIYALILPNGRLAINVADSGGSPDFKYQHYSDFALITERPYHICIHAEFGDHFDLYIDGVLQTSTHGGTLGADTTMSTHSGDWSFGDPGANLDTGGVDIAYDAANPMYLAHWGTWSGVGGGSPLSPTTDIRDRLFRDGALPEHTIVTGTEAAMQTAIEAYDSQTHADWPLTYQINDVTGSGDFELTLTDQVWPDECKFHICFIGPDELTIRNSGTSNFQTAKAWSPTNGTFAVIETAGITITVKDISTDTVIVGARVLVEAGATGPLTEGDDIISGVTNASGQISSEIDFTTDQSITGKVRDASGSTKYKQSAIVGTIPSAGLDLTIFMIRDE